MPATEAAFQVWPFGRCWQITCTGSATMTVESKHLALRGARLAQPSQVIHTADGQVEDQFTFPASTPRRPAQLRPTRG